MKGLAGAASCGGGGIQLEGELDLRAAARTLARVGELACEVVVLDLARVRRSSDVAFAFLAGGLTRVPRSRVRMHGVAPQQRRLLEEVGAGALLGDRR
jgi:hypothetical protein